jgi:alkyl hydroperoxide reductase subunit AhpC
MRTAPLSLWLALVSALVLGEAWGAPKEEDLKIGDTAPQFAMKTINAELSKVSLFALSRHVGESPAEPKQALVLSFAASYCEPCKKELGELRAMDAQLKKAGVLLAVVVIDTEPDGIESMRKLTVDELKLPYPVLSDRFGVLARRYHANTLPHVVIVDKVGTIQWIHSGFTKDALDQLRSKLGI